MKNYSKDSFVNTDQGVTLISFCEKIEVPTEYRGFLALSGEHKPSHIPTPGFEPGQCVDHRGNQAAKLVER